MASSNGAINLSEERLNRLEDGQSKQNERIAVNEAANSAAFVGIKSDLRSIEDKVDKVVDAVASQHDLWVRSPNQRKANQPQLGCAIGHFRHFGLLGGSRVRYKRRS